MKSFILLFSTICLLIANLALRAEDKGATSTNPPGETKTYQTSSSPSPTPEHAPQLSRKCAIYSGICKMVRPVEVGSYCVCMTPSGEIFGVVIP